MFAEKGCIFDLIEAFPTYSFKAGEPVVFEPYVHALIVEYHTPSDGYLAEFIQYIRLYSEI